MALSDVRTLVCDNINRDDITDTSGGLIDQWINDTQRQICRAFDFTFMETEVTATTVDDQRTYLLPAGTGTNLRFKTEISCELIDDDDTRIPLSKIHKQDAERRYTDYDDTGTPERYAVQGGYIWLYPTPNDNSGDNWTINFEYYGYLDDLSADTDTNDLITNYPEIVEMGATARGFKYAHEWEKAKNYEADFKSMVFNMAKEALTNRYATIEEGMEPREGSGAYK